MLGVFLQLLSVVLIHWCNRGRRRGRSYCTQPPACTVPFVHGRCYVFPSSIEWAPEWNLCCRLCLPIGVMQAFPEGQSHHPTSVTQIGCLNWVVSLCMLPLLLIEKLFPKMFWASFFWLSPLVSFSHWLCRHPEFVVFWLPWNCGIKTFPAYLPSMNVASFCPKLYAGSV